MPRRRRMVYYYDECTESIRPTMRRIAVDLTQETQEPVHADFTEVVNSYVERETPVWYDALMNIHACNGGCSLMCKNCMNNPRRALSF